MRTRRSHGEEAHVNHERWLVSYADFITLLFAFFVVMFSVSQVDERKLGRFSESVKAATLDKNEHPAASLALPAGDLRASSSVTISGVGPVPDETGSSLRAKIQSRLADAIRLGRITIVQTDGGVVMRLSDKSFFNSGSARVQPQTQDDLKQIADMLKDSKFTVSIEGHTDAIPISNVIYRSNWELSSARAASVLTTLVQFGEINPDHLSVVGYADRKPIASNDTDAGRALNRRVEIVVHGAK